jgi:hypothetical protein
MKEYNGKAVAHGFTVELDVAAGDLHEESIISQLIGNVNGWAKRGAGRPRPGVEVLEWQIRKWQFVKTRKSGSPK